MFLVNKYGDCTVKVNQVDMRMQYEYSVLEKADEIRSGIMAKCYNYGSTENAKRVAEEKVKLYLSDKIQICRILVNNELYFGDYNEEQGKMVLERIVEALRNEEKFLDMRDI